MKKILLLVILLITLTNSAKAEFQVIKPFFYIDLKTEKKDKNDNTYSVYLIRYAKHSQVLKNNTFLILPDCNIRKMSDNNYNYYHQN